jgi:hypothetical protein
VEIRRSSSVVGFELAGGRGGQRRTRAPDLLYVRPPRTVDLTATRCRAGAVRRCGGKRRRAVIR